MTQTNIQPVTVPTIGIATTFCIRVIDFTLGSSVATFYWFAQNTDNKIILEGNLNMTTPEIDSWGVDDNYVIDWALNELGFTKI